ncbi:hypothetical protein K439DRAFT_1634668 [Ramaria rubella]|nr:hypothetical protein K439DRAFT_1634668 [Ramaria rubella]
MEHTLCNPFIPRASVYRFPNGIFEIHIHLPGFVSDVEVTPHENYVILQGNFIPRGLRRDVNGRGLVWTDQAFGRFGRDIPIGLNPGTEYVLLEHRHDCDDYVIRYTVRNRFANRGVCAPIIPNANPCTCNGRVNGQGGCGQGAGFNQGIGFGFNGTNAYGHHGKSYSFGASYNNGYGGYSVNAAVNGGNVPQGGCGTGPGLAQEYNSGGVAVNGPPPSVDLAKDYVDSKA